MRKRVIFGLLLLFSFKGQTQQTRSDVVKHIRKGIASFYHNRFEGKKTASGEVFDNREYTAASGHLKIGSFLRVTNLKNQAVVYVRVNDRMPQSNGRLVDLAQIAAKALGFHQHGVATVHVQVVTAGEGQRAIAKQKATTFSTL